MGCQHPQTRLNLVHSAKRPAGGGEANCQSRRVGLTNPCECTRFEQLTIEVANTSIDPAVALAPMAGITDLPFRRIVGRFGAGLVVSEMVASQEMVQAKPGVRELYRGRLFGQPEFQLAGRD